MGRLFSSNPVTKTRTDFHWDDVDQSFVLETKQDVEDIVELNKAEFNATDERARWRDGQQVGRIPLWLYFKLRRENVIDPDGTVQDETRFLKWLDAPENRAWRTRPGRLSR